MTKKELTLALENLMMEHNKLTCLLEFILNKLVDKEIITTEEFSKFLTESEAFNININEVNTLPNPDEMLNILESEEE